MYVYVFAHVYIYACVYMQLVYGHGYADVERLRLMRGPGPWYFAKAFSTQARRLQVSHGPPPNILSIHDNSLFHGVQTNGNTPQRAHTVTRRAEMPSGKSPIRSRPSAIIARSLEARRQAQPRQTQQR